MGCNQSAQNLTPEEKEKLKNERKQSKDIGQQGYVDHRKDEETLKLLLLGTGGSGKSTLFKQMITLYKRQMNETDRKKLVPTIYSNVIGSIKTLVDQSDLLSEDFPKCAVGNNLLDTRDFIFETKANSPVTPDIAEAIKSLWEDEGIKNTYLKRSCFQLTDSTEYFFQRVDAIAADDYVPSYDDVLRARVRTTGILEEEFDISKNRFKIFDVGGQRNERKKWIHCFDKVSGVLFVASLSEYDQQLYEDESQNRMVEALALFEEICNSRWFKDAAMILFLNKKDLFAEKIKTSPITNVFPEYDGEQEYQACCDYITEQFHAQNKDEDKDIHVHLTCATDTLTLKQTFESMKDFIIRRSLQQAGLD